MSIRNLNTNITNIRFKNSMVVYENFIKCTIKDYEYNLSYNPTLLSGSQGLLTPYTHPSGSTTIYVNQQQNDGVLKDFATGSISGSEFSPYVGSIGLYNDAGDLLAVAKMAAPMPISTNTDMTFLIKYDTVWVDKPYFTPSPTPSPSPSVTPSFTPSISITPTVTPSTSVSTTPSVTPTVTPSVSVTPSVTPSVSITPSISVTPTITPSLTVSSSPPPASGYFYMGVTSTYSSGANACSARTCGRPYYLPAPVVYIGQRIYNDVGLSSPYNGNNLWIAISYNCAGSWNVVQVDGSGYVTNVYSPCP